MGRWLSIVVLAGCGRVAFDALPDTGTTAPCPPGMIAVAGNAQLGTRDFCVMQFEAKAWIDTDGDSTIDVGELDDDGCTTPACDVEWTAPLPRPVAVASAQPFRSITQLNAVAACRSLGPDYSLIANREWMTIARDAERVPANWSTGVPGSGRMVEGNTDDASTLFYNPVSDPADPYSDTGNSAADPPGAGWEQRRTLELSTGAVLWDVPGNVQEWIDWTLGDPLDPAPVCSGAELPAFSCPGVVDDDFNSSTGTLDSTNGAGRVLGGTNGGGRRGGQAGDLSIGIAGIYALNMNRTPTTIYLGTGFRCVYHPPTGMADADIDFVADSIDNCPALANPDQANEDGDSFGDACDPCPPVVDAVPAVDPDGDGVSEGCDPRPTLAGDRVALFDGFNRPPQALQAQIDGTWMFDGAAHVTSSLDEESAVTWVVPLQVTTNVSTVATADAYFGTSVARPIGVVMQYAKATRDGTMCVFGINPSNNQVVALADNATTVALAATPATATVGTTSTFSLRESPGNVYLCQASATTTTLSANNSVVSTPNRIGVFARSASAHFAWAMIVTSP